MERVSGYSMIEVLWAMASAAAAKARAILRATAEERAQRAAARELQVSRTTMWRLMKKHGIEV